MPRASGKRPKARTSEGPKRNTFSEMQKEDLGLMPRSQEEQYPTPPKEKTDNDTKTC